MKLFYSDKKVHRSPFYIQMLATDLNILIGYDWPNWNQVQLAIVPIQMKIFDVSRMDSTQTKLKQTYIPDQLSQMPTFWWVITQLGRIEHAGFAVIGNLVCWHLIQVFCPSKIMTIVIPINHFYSIFVFKCFCQFEWS